MKKMKANTKIFGCIADPIDHVKAPTLFTEMFQKQKINAIMIPINEIDKLLILKGSSSSSLSKSPDKVLRECLSLNLL